MKNSLKKILFVIPDLRFGGTISSLSNIYNAIKGRYDIHVYALYDKQIGDYSFKEKVLKTNKLTYCYYSYLSDLKGVNYLIVALAKVILRIMKKMGFDVVKYVNTRAINRLDIESYDLIVAFQEGSATLFVSSINKPIPKFAWIHCDYARYNRITERNELPLYNRFDKIVNVSKYTSTSFVSIYPSLKDRVVTIYNLYDKERVIKLSRHPIEDTLFNNQLFTILSVGRIDKVKRFSEIPSIAKRLIDAGYKFRWFIIGNIVEQEEYDSIIDNINDYQLKDTVILLGGKINPYPYFATSNLFVSTSSSEACPIVFLEAQSLNLPIVSTNFGSASEFINNGMNGYITSLERISDKIIEVIEGHLTYQQYEVIDNEKIINQISQYFNEQIK